MSDMSKSASPELDIPVEPLPVTVLTGFLGSGKTTLLRHLLTEPGLENTAVVINEFGEIGLDHLLVEKADENTVLLNSGCLCCTVRGDLVDTLRSLYRRRVKREVIAFERVVIETTGLADPAPILHTLMSDPLLGERFRLDGVVTLVDAANGMATLDLQGEAVKQAAVADRLLVSKCDLVSGKEVEALETRLRALNPAAPIFRVENGKIAADKLLDAGLYDPKTKSLEVARWLKAEAYEGEADQPGGHGHQHHGHHGHDVNRHDDRIRAFCITYDRPLDWERLNDWVEMLISTRGRDILRMKALLDVAGQERPVVVHGVQHVFHPPALLERWPSDERRSRLVFITRDLDRRLFEESFKAFIEESVS